VLLGGIAFRLAEDLEFAALAARLLPLRDGHFLQQVSLGAVLRLPAGLQVVAEFFELGGVFTGKDHGAGREAVFEGVEPDGLFALRGTRTRGFLRVEAIGLGAFIGRFWIHRMWENSSPFSTSR
jgi:hypothetical protein